MSIYLHIFISSLEYFFQFQFHFLRIIINNYKYKYNYKYRLSILASTSYVFFTSWLWSFICFFGKNSADSLRQIRHKTDFLWPVFSRIRTESRISPYTGKCWSEKTCNMKYFMQWLFTYIFLARKTIPIQTLFKATSTNQTRASSIISPPKIT